MNIPSTQMSFLRFVCVNIVTKRGIHFHGYSIGHRHSNRRTSLKISKFINTIGWVEVITSKVLRSPPWVGWPLRNICVTIDHRYVPLVVSTPLSFPHSWLIIGFVPRVTWWVPLVEQELLTLPEHLGSPPVISEIRVTRSLVFCGVLCRSLFILLVIVLFDLHYVVWPSSIYKFFLWIIYIHCKQSVHWKACRYYHINIMNKREHTNMSRPSFHGPWNWH
jgi:hypothetical protein